MSISTPFIKRPVATTLLLVALTLAGGIAYTLLPVSALPEVDFPTISVSASLPGASPDVMAASVATPLEKQFTRIAGVTEMTSRSSVGSAMITLQFDLSRDINGAAREVQAAINSSAGFLTTNPSEPNPMPDPYTRFARVLDKKSLKKNKLQSSGPGLEPCRILANLIRM